MNKKKIFNIIAILMGVIIFLGFGKVNATNFDTGITRENLTAYTSNNLTTQNATTETLKLIDSGYSYTDGIQKKIWKIINQSIPNNIYYCLNMAIGFEGMAENSTDEYTYKNEITKNDIDNYSGLSISNENYNKILWILNNSYIPSNSQDFYNDSSYKLLMKNANINIYSDKTFNLTIEDILTAQKLAIWHYTNNFIAIRSIEGIPDTNKLGNYGEIIAKSRKNKLIDLYNYLVQGAENNGSNYRWQEPVITSEISSTQITEKNNSYIVGPLNITADNISAIKSLNITCNKEFNLLNSSKNSVENNNFLDVINEEEFYLEIAKDVINQNTTIELAIEYTYDKKDLIFMTNISEKDSTQPVVKVINIETNNNKTIEIPITLKEVLVEKIWDDLENQDGVRPNNVKVQLYKNNNAYGESVTLNKNNNWNYAWRGLLDGHTYTVKELNNNTAISDGGKLNNNYTVSYQVNNNKTIITNTHTPEKVEKTVNKVWVDNNNQDGKRAEYGVTLKADGENVGNEVKLNSTQTTYTWRNLPKYKDGKEIVYTVEETTVPNEYTVTYSEDTFTITNTHTPEKVEKTVNKVWVDNNNQDGKRAEYGVTLKADGENVGNEVKLNSTQTTYTWRNLPKYKDGKEIVYTVEETTVPNGYTVTYSEDTFTITNTHTPEKVEKTVNKVWVDNNNQDGKRAEYGVTLKADGENVGNEVKLNSTQTTYTWRNLPKYKDGKEIVYTVEETTVPNEYTVTYSEDTFTITNTYTPGKINLKVIKEWEDQENNDKIRPTSVIVKLYKTINDEKEEVDSQELNESNNWMHTWSGLDKMHNGEEIIYSVEENPVDKYSTEYSSEDYSNTNEITITNRYTPEKINLKVIKEWDDQENKDEIRPTSVIVKLYKTINDEKEEVNSQELNESNNWMHTWSGLDKMHNGEKIIYSVEENPVDKYSTEYSSEDYSNTNEITITNRYTPEVITGKYNIVLRKVDENDNILRGSKFKVNGTEYDLSEGEVTIHENQQITEENMLNGIDFTYLIEETLIPVGYNGIENTEVNIKASVKKEEKNYILSSAELVDGEGKKITSENISIKLNGETIIIEVKNTPIEKKFDLALRKFITKVNDIAYSREPIVDTSTIESTGTATYKHIKTPIVVQKGDIVTYTIRIFNEGEIDGYVDAITDYLPNNLIPIIEGKDEIDSKKYEKEIEFNSKWLWLMSPENNNAITTTITSKLNEETYSILTGLEEVKDTKLDAYKKESNRLDYIDVQLKCLVGSESSNGEYLTNIAEITDGQDINGVKGDGLDSTLNNVDHSNLIDYKNNEAISSTIDSYIKGQEDDDDFEKLLVHEFDLALRKFITKVNDTVYSREPVVDTSKLGTNVNEKLITTATYNHSKQPVIVKTDDIVTYKIRIYNEGSLAGFVNEITDNIPNGLEFLPESTINKLYKWKMIDKDGNETQEISKAVSVVTNYLSNEDKNNLINSVVEQEGKKVLSYKDVEIQFKVTAKPEKLKNNIIINEAQISADSENDIDSVPNRDEKYDYISNNNEDDIDFELIKLQYFDLALKKFVTQVNNVNYNNRYPEIIFNDNGSITYNQTKDPVLVTTGDDVTYTIRIYNEGEISGYATEIKDNLPDGMAFDPNNETNKLYGWKMIDSQGNITDDASKVVAFTTDYLKNELIESLEYKNAIKMLSYKDIKITFKVTESMLSDRILANIAEISKDSDDDIDSIPGNGVLTEDDIDKEYVKVQYFDLSLKKWVTKTQVTLDGKTTTNITDYDEDTDEIAKVDLVASKMKKAVVKFTYNIKVTNEGELPGYAYEIKDYIPKGFEFIEEENSDWKELENGMVVTEKLKDTLLNPGESATVEIVLTWKNSTTNTGLKTNYAEISKASADDIDSVPDNFDFTEDDIDDAQVIISIKTAGPTTYIGLVLIAVSILAGGIYAIRKYVID